jgi:hypothetical protein
MSKTVDGVRLNAAETLWKTKKAEPKEIVRSLAAVLHSTNSLYQLRSIDLLRQCGTDALELLPQLKERTRSPIGFISVWAVKAVAEIERSNSKDK